MTTFTLSDLEAMIASRAGADPAHSHTAKLLAAGPETCARKFGEEAIEAVIAALTQDRVALIGESADVLFHLLVLLRSREIALSDVLSELQRRTAQSGLAEKAARNV